jgi:preprotein translocase subunit SecD
MNLSKETRLRLAVIGGIILASVWLLWHPEKAIHLGLDLSGGTHLRFEVETSDAVRAEADQAATSVREKFREKNWVYENVQRPPDAVDQVLVTGADLSKAGDMEPEFSQILPAWKFSMEGGNALRFTLDAKTRADIESAAVRQAVDTIRNRVDEFGVTEPTVQREGAEGRRLVVQLPGVDDPARAKEIVKRTAFLEWKPLAGAEAESQASVSRQFPNAVIPDGVQVLPGGDDKTRNQFFPVKTSSILTGRDLTNARPTQDEMGLPAVSFMLNPDAAERIRKYSEENIGQRVAVILDGKVLTAPSIRDRLGASNIISGRFTPQEAQDLALQLRAGALPATLIDIEERSIGPSLGADSIRKGIITGLVCIAAVFIMMVALYRLSGINAVFCLLLNTLMTFAMLVLFGATLTLPGVAGLVLTLGMAVDANILIFERIKEELRAGKTPRGAVAAGFERALTAIWDGNLTTILTCIFLFQFGTGPIRGFAVTMIIGLVANLFTAIFVSRTLFEFQAGGRASRAGTLSI